MSVTNAQHPEIETRALLEALDNVKALILEIIDRDFAGHTRLRSYIVDRVKRAKAILRDVVARLREITYHGVEGFRIVFASSEYLEKGGEKTVVLKKLTGGLAVIKIGTPIERSIHVVEVSRWRLKCTCPDAIFTSAKADRVLQLFSRYRTEPVLYRYTLCKHILASLAILSTIKALSLEDPILRETLWLATLTAFLRIASDKDRDLVKRVVERGIEILKKRSVIR